MYDFGDGREERMAALDLELRLKRNPAVKQRKAQYEAGVCAAYWHARNIGSAAIIAELIAHNPAYVRSLLESSGDDVLADRYARTFYKHFSANPLP